MKQVSKKDLPALLRNQVLEMKLQPGSLVDEAELAETFGVSRTPLRETIQRLAGEGYFVIERNRGAMVAPMDLATMRQFFQAAPVIYASIARLAAENATRAQTDELKEIQRAYRASLGQGEPSTTAMHNHRFHAQIGTMAGSPYLLPSLNRLLIDHTRIGQKFYTRHGRADETRVSAAAGQHDAMISAFERHAPAEAVQVTLEHWALSRDQMERYVRPTPLPHDPAGEFEDLNSKGMSDAV